MGKRGLIISTALLCLVIFLCSLISASSVGLIENSTWQEDLIGVYHSSLVFGDIDSDGDIDLVLSGYNGSNYAKVYVNNGTSLVENSTWQADLIGIYWSSLSLGDIDNDGDLDLALSGCLSSSDPGRCLGGQSIKIYINNGTSLVENSTWQENLIGVSEGTIVFGDIDNDGDLDLGATGFSSVSGKNAKIYINNGMSLVENSTWQENLVGVYQSSMTFGDVDNDGDLDLALSGESDTVKVARIYKNNGTSLVEDSRFEVIDKSSMVFSDYDNDGDLDFIYMGCCDVFFVHNNDGTGSFSENQTYTVEGGNLVGIFDGSIALGDYDNDGDLDLVGIGREAGRNRVYENIGNVFTGDETAEANLPNVQKGSIVWVDIDDDNDLDMVVNGQLYIGVNPSSPLTKIYINNITTANIAPSPPTTGFSSSFASGRLTLSWGSGSDTKTPTNGLYYNLRVGTTSGGNDIVSGVYGGSSNPTAGYFGNMMQRKSVSLSGLSSSTTYYWSVQTIDTALAKGSWSAEQTYTTEANLVDPVITLNVPVNLHNTSNAAITFDVTVTDDSGLANVTLYGNWSAWHANETNTSGTNGDYIFTKDLSAPSDGVYVWGIRACDTSKNCLYSSNRTFTIDTTDPSISLTSPADGSNWTSSSTVTFTYSVSDLAIANCSLIIGGGIVETDSSIAIGSNNFSRSMSNAAHIWSVNCTDFTDHTGNSTTRSLTVSYTYTGPSNGGGGGGAAGGITYNIGSLTATGATKQVAVNDEIKFIVNELEKTATITALGADSVTLTLLSQVFSLAVGEEKKLDINDDDVYDTSITLDSVTESKASLTFKAISEVMPAEEIAKKNEKKAEEEKKEEIERKEKRKTWIAIVVVILVAAIAFMIAYRSWRRMKKKVKI